MWKREESELGRGRGRGRGKQTMPHTNRPGLGQDQRGSPLALEVREGTPKTWANQIFLTRRTFLEGQHNTHTHTKGTIMQNYIHIRACVCVCVRQDTRKTADC